MFENSIRGWWGREAGAEEKSKDGLNKLYQLL